MLARGNRAGAGAPWGRARCLLLDALPIGSGCHTHRACRAAGDCPASSASAEPAVAAGLSRGEQSLRHEPGRPSRSMPHAHVHCRRSWWPCSHACLMHGSGRAWQCLPPGTEAALTSHVRSHRLPVQRPLSPPPPQLRIRAHDTALQHCLRINASLPPMPIDRRPARAKCGRPCAAASRRQLGTAAAAAPHLMRLHAQLVH